MQSSDPSDATYFADEIRKTLGLTAKHPIRIRHRPLPDGVACALAYERGELMVLVDEGKPLAADHALQVLAEITGLASLLLHRL